jgi:hypothetical protein
MVVGVCVVFAVIDARVPGNAAVQRDDWRGVARVLGAPRETRAIEVSPGWQASTLVLYVPRLAPLRAARVKEFVTIEYHGVQAWRSPIRLLTPGAPFRRVQTVVQQHMTVTRYEAPTPVSLSARPLTGAGLNASLPFVQTAR